MEILLAIISGAFSGLLVGFLPGVGATVLMLTTMPILLSWHPASAIIFYATAIQASHFSGSVASINFGLLGEATSDPALRERPTVISNGLEKSALKYTALGSFLACVFALFFVQIAYNVFSVTSFVLRTDFFVLIMTIILGTCVFWKNNPKIINVFLICVGVILGHIGHHSSSSSIEEYHFLTFNMSELFNGIPSIVILASFLAVPALIKFRNIDLSQFTVNSSSQKIVAFPTKSFLRGTVLGLFAGLIPMIGNMISSNLAWTVEKHFKQTDSTTDSMSRLVSAESANNSSQITVLLPLLILGIAIVPSEIVLLNILEYKDWMMMLDGWSVFDFNLFTWIGISAIIGCAISYLICYTFVLPISLFLKNHLKALNWFTLSMMLLSVAYLGLQVENQTFYLLAFICFSAVTVFYRKTDFIPLVAGFLLSDSIIYKLPTLFMIYFN